MKSVAVSFYVTHANTTNSLLLIHSRPTPLAVDLKSGKLIRSKPSWYVPRATKQSLSSVDCKASYVLVYQVLPS